MIERQQVLVAEPALSTGGGMLAWTLVCAVSTVPEKSAPGVVGSAVRRGCRPRLSLRRPGRKGRSFDMIVGATDLVFAAELVSYAGRVQNTMALSLGADRLLGTVLRIRSWSGLPDRSDWRSPG